MLLVCGTASAQQSTPFGTATTSPTWFKLGTGGTSRIALYNSSWYYPLLVLQDTTSLVATQNYVRTHAGAAPIEFTISAGTAIPYNYSYGGVNPSVTFSILTGGSVTSNGADGIVYTLSGGVMMIYGNNNGGVFNEDTYVRISP